MLRRTLFSIGTAALAGSVLSLKAQTPALRLGYDTYSIRAWGWKAVEHLEYAGSLGLTALQLSSMGDFESFEPAYLMKVRDRAKQLNLYLDGGTGCICPASKAWGKRTDDPVEYLSKAIDASKAIGAHSVRCFVGSAADRTGGDAIEKLMDATLPVLKACRARALDAGLKIAVENHGDFQAWELRQLLETAGTDYTAACLDTGNPMSVLESPETTLEVLGPVAAATHWRDTCLYPHPRGAAGMWTSMGEGTMDLAAMAAIQKRLAPSVPLHLEIITGRPPQVFPFLDPAYMARFPKARATEFARYLAMVQKGLPFSGRMVMEDAAGQKPPEFVAALKAQQKYDLDRSLAYSKEKLIG